MITRWLDVSTVNAVTESEAANSSKRTDIDAERAARNEREESSADTTITFRASVESEDRAGDVIRAEGWELENYRLNPVVLWAHRHDLLPVGKSVDIWVENGALMARIEFAPTEFAQQIKRLFLEGFLRGVSVGFRALRTSPRPGSGRRGTVFEKQELLEISAAPVPMHPEALQAAKGGSSDISEQGDEISLFRELTEIWQSISTGQSNKETN